MDVNKKPQSGSQPTPGTDALAFEVVSFDQARQAHEEPPPGVQQSRRPGPTDWASRRRALTEAERRISRASTQWVLALPREIRPMELMRRYSRIANLLCDTWEDAESALHLLEDLVLDRRGGRQGFPRAVAVELQALRDHLQRRLRQSRR
jgi:hypothetical protein